MSSSWANKTTGYGVDFSKQSQPLQVRRQLGVVVILHTSKKLSSLPIAGMDEHLCKWSTKMEQ